MRTWLFVVGAVLLAIPLVLAALRTREISFDVEPVSRHWLEEQKRATDDA